MWISFLPWNGTPSLHVTSPLFNNNFIFSYSESPLCLSRELVVIIKPNQDSPSASDACDALQINYHSHEMDCESFCRVPSLSIGLNSYLDLQNFGLDASFRTTWGSTAVSVSTNVYIYKNMKRLSDLFTRKSQPNAVFTGNNVSKAVGSSNFIDQYLRQINVMPWLCYYHKVPGTLYGSDYGISRPRTRTVFGECEYWLLIDTCFK